MLGLIIGDIISSNPKHVGKSSNIHDLLHFRTFFTEYSVISISTSKFFSSIKSEMKDIIKTVKVELNKYLDSGISLNNIENKEEAVLFLISFAIGYYFDSIETALEIAKEIFPDLSTKEIMKVNTIINTVFLIRADANLLYIRDFVNNTYKNFTFRLDNIEEVNDEVKEDVVLLSILILLESKDFTNAAKTSLKYATTNPIIPVLVTGFAEAYYGVPTSVIKHTMTFLDENLLNTLFTYNLYDIKFKNGVNANQKVPLKNTERREKIMEKIIDKINENVTDESAEEISSRQLFNHLFEACNILRGPINQDEYKSYVTPILFFKRISDVYDEETEMALKVSDGDKKFASFAENHSFVIPDGCHWSDVRNISENVGVAIVGAMSGIERANPDTLSGVFSSFDDASWTDKSKLTDERLKDLIEHMSSIKVGNNNYSADVMGDAYEFLIKKFADLSKKNAGEFYTPRPIVKLLVKLLDPKPGEDVYDPACGTGGMLIEAIEHIADQKFTYGRIYGQEKNLATSAIARMNLFLHGARDFTILQGDTLRNPKFIKAGQIQRFDCVIGNPPFSLKKWGSEIFSIDPYGRNIWGTPGDSRADFAWLQHMVKSMNKKHGRCAVILPQGVLFRGGLEKTMRKKLIESDILECVITLNNGVFFSTGVAACILLLNKNKPLEKRNKVLMIDGVSFSTSQRAQVIMTEGNVEDLFQVYKKFNDAIEISKVVDIDTMKKHQYSLYVNDFIEKIKIKPTTLVVARAEYEDSYNNMIKAENKMKKRLLEGGLIYE